MNPREWSARSCTRAFAPGRSWRWRRRADASPWTPATHPVLLLSAGHRRHAGAVDAARAGRGAVHARGVVAARCAQQQLSTRSPPKSGHCSRSCPTLGRAICYSAPLPTDRLGRDYTRPRSTLGRRPRRADPPARRARLHLRTAGVHDATQRPPSPVWVWTRHACTPRCSAPAPRSHPASRPARRPRRTRPPASRSGPGGHLRAQWPHGAVAGGLRQPPRARRGVRRADALVVPDRGLPHLRGRAAGRRRCPTTRRRSTLPPTATCWSAAPRPSDDVVIDL